MLRKQIHLQFIFDYKHQPSVRRQHFMRCRRRPSKYKKHRNESEYFNKQSIKMCEGKGGRAWKRKWRIDADEWENTRSACEQPKGTTAYVAEKCLKKPYGTWENKKKAAILVCSTPEHRLNGIRLAEMCIYYSICTFSTELCAPGFIQLDNGRYTYMCRCDLFDENNSYNSNTSHNPRNRLKLVRWSRSFLPPTPLNTSFARPLSIRHGNNMRTYFIIHFHTDAYQWMRSFLPLFFCFFLPFHSEMPTNDGCKSNYGLQWFFFASPSSTREVGFFQLNLLQFVICVYICSICCSLRSLCALTILRIHRMNGYIIVCECVCVCVRRQFAQIYGSIKRRTSWIACAKYIIIIIIEIMMGFCWMVIHCCIRIECFLNSNESATTHIGYKCNREPLTFILYPASIWWLLHSINVHSFVAHRSVMRFLVLHLVGRNNANTVQCNKKAAWIRENFNELNVCNKCGTRAELTTPPRHLYCAVYVCTVATVQLGLESLLHQDISKEMHLK